jgi:hypothetical protein
VGEVLRTKWWFYLLLAIADVEANFLVVKAYQYTTITSVMLLDCFSIPCVMVHHAPPAPLPSPSQPPRVRVVRVRRQLDARSSDRCNSLSSTPPPMPPPPTTTTTKKKVLSFVFLKARYNAKHYLGVGLCLAGLGALVASDAHYNRDDSTQLTPFSPAHHARARPQCRVKSQPNPTRQPNLTQRDIYKTIGGEDPVLGDILCLCGALLYAISNVGQEGSVKQFDRVEFLAMLGMFGSGLNIVQSLRTLPFTPPPLHQLHA